MITTDNEAQPRQAMNCQTGATKNKIPSFGTMCKSY